MSEDVMMFVVLATAAVLIVTQIARLWRNAMQHKTIREAISRDNASVPAFLASIEEPRAIGANDDRTAYVLIAIALALISFGLIHGNGDDILTHMVGAAVFPGFVGGALLLRHYLARRRAA